ncbi:MAG TPA: diguanylate cyclase [Gammaproteobacteria bacterium]|nr:diguanylate cyclase [Gammaproteobacteria bacterium]
MNDSPTRARDISIYVSAGAVTLLGSAIMLAWHARFDRLVQLRPNFPPMQYNTALCLLLCGAGVLCLRLRRGLALVPAFAVIGIAGASLLEYVLRMNLGIDELLMQAHINVVAQYAGRMSPQAAGGLLLAGAALAMLALPRTGRHRTLIVEVLGSLAGALGLAAVVAYASGIEQTYGWMQAKFMALHTGLALVALGYALLQSAWWLEAAQDSRRSRLLAVPVGIGAVAVTLALFQELGAWQVQSTNEETMRAVERTAAEVRSRVDGYLESFGMLAETWGRGGGRPLPSWDADVARFLRDHQVFQAVSWGDSDGKFRWIFPVEPFPDYIGLDYTADPQRYAALVAARERSGPVLTRTLALKSGLPGVVMVAPLPPQQTNGPFVVGAIRIRDLFRASALALPGYWLEVFDGDRLVYTSADAGSVRNDWTRATGVSLDRAAWRIEVTPAPATLDAMRSPLPGVVLLAGLLASALLALTAHFAQVSLRREGELLAANAELSATKRQLERLALFDDLTGLGNRNLLALELDKQLGVARQRSTSLPLLLIDLDGFKQVNDTFGHEAGDTVLREVGVRLQRALHAEDRGFRAGGDEFAVLMRPGAALDDALAAAHAITQAMSAPLLLGAESRVVTASVGIAIYPDHGRDRERLMRSADAAMYQAKHDPAHIRVASEESPTAVLRALRGARAPRP